MQKSLIVLLLSILAVSCAEETDAPTESVQPTGGGKGDQVDSGLAPTYEEFRAGLYCEEGGACIVQGDVPIWGEEALQEYYYSRRGLVQGLTVMNTSAVDAIWDRTERFDLRYCISDDFGERKAEVVQAFNAAVEEWEEIADVDLVYATEHDARCSTRNAQVVFNVRPGDDPFASYIARAFFPNYKEREKREVIIAMDEHDRMAESDTIEGDYTLQGVLRHEIGHVLGFRHEHIRDEANAYFCREGDDYRPITTYDATSVMHYPQCNGKGDWALTLSDIDRRGASFFYPDFNDYTAARCDEETRDGDVLDTCEPVVHQMLELANTATFEELDIWVGLDIRAAQTIVDTRRTTPFNTLQQLKDVPYIGPVSVMKMYDYLYKTGRCPVEFDENGVVNAQCRPVVNRILELANTATQDQLDFEVGLDSRAAANIVVIRENRPFASFAELWDVSYVKATAFERMYFHLFE